jgi:hypothetical protein
MENSLLPKLGGGFHVGDPLFALTTILILGGDCLRSPSSLSDLQIAYKLFYQKVTRGITMNEMGIVIRACGYAPTQDDINHIWEDKQKQGMSDYSYYLISVL